jgi:gas vesicle protein
MFVEPKINTMTMPRYYEGYQDDDSNNAGTALLTFVLGAVAGVAAGMLLAPSSGQESRRKIASAATDLASKAGDQWGTVKEKATTTINKVTRKNDAGGTTPNPTDQFNNL